MIDLDEGNFKESISNASGGIVVVDFWADWCGPCKMLSPILDTLDQEMGSVNFAKVDADANMNLANKYSVASIPTVMVFKNGEPIAKQVGAKPYALMKKFIEDSLNS